LSGPQSTKEPVDGAVPCGPVTKPGDLQPAIDQGIKTVRKGGVRVLDARMPPGYDAEG